MTLLFYKVEYSTNRSSIYQKAKSPNIPAEKITKRINETIQRKTDILCLYENDIFALLLPQTIVMGAKLLAQRIERSLRTDEFISSLSLSALRINFGIASLNTRCKTLNSLLGAAEFALTMATKGKINIVSYEDIISEAVPAMNIPGGSSNSIEPSGKIPDLKGMRSLIGNMISEEYKIFSYPAFLLLAKYELLMAARNRNNLLILVFRLYKPGNEIKEETLPMK